MKGSSGRLLRVDADVVVNMINGDSNLYFYNELHRQGISAADLPVLATSIGEDELRGLLPETVEGHLAASNYFQSIDTPRNRCSSRVFSRSSGKTGS